MKKKVKFIIWGLVILAVMGSAAYTLTASTVIPLTNIVAKDAQLSFSEQGTLVADSVVQIFPLVQGRVIQVNVREGQQVHEGDVLCVIDPEPQQLKIEQLQLAIKGYQAQKSSATAVVQEQLRLQNILIEQSQKDLDLAMDELSRAESLYQAGSISAVDLQHAQSAVEKCESALRTSRQQLSVIAAGSEQGNADYYNALIEAEEANIAQLERDIENCNVVATVDGVVTALSAKDTNYVTSAASVAEITVLNSDTIETYVSTKDVDSIKLGDTVYLTLKRRESDIEFTGTVTHMDPTAEVRLSALGVEERRVKVQISPNLYELNGASLGAGYNVDVKFIVYNENNKFIVPKTALFKDGNKDMLWVVRKGRARAIEITKGMELRTETVIESGLVEGDWVVTDANNKDLKDGLKVKGE